MFSAVPVLIDASSATYTVSPRPADLKAERSSARVDTTNSASSRATVRV